MTKKTIGTIIVLAGLPIVLLAGQNGLSPDKLQKANSEKAVSAATDAPFSLFDRDRATAAGSEKAPQLNNNGLLFVDQTRSSMAELSNSNQSPDLGFSTGSKSEASRELQTERTTTGLFSVDRPQSSRDELSNSNRSSDLGVSLGSDNKARQELGEFVHDISRDPASDQ